jgi:signal transduction histidine kinase/CheY-like chemotaxis protein
MSKNTDDLKISDIMKPVTQSIPESMPVDQISKMDWIARDGVGLVVNAKGELTGALREKEVLLAMVHGRNSDSAASIMIPVSETISPQASHHEASKLLLRSHQRFLPVVDGKRPVGIVWTDSSLSAMTTAYRAKYDEWMDALAKIKYRDEFLGILVHDLRSPLSSITACCDLIKMNEEAMPPAHRDLMATIKRNAFRCINLAQDLLEFGKLNSGMNVQLDFVEIHTVLDEIVKNLDLIGRQKYGITLQTDWCGMIGAQIDRSRFTQIIDNLVNNAFKVTPRGKSVTIKTELVDDFKRNNKSIKIRVIDEGPGIPRDKVNTIFDKYTQLDTPQQGGKEQGVGLGLSIVAQFVRLHNGQIFVDGGGEGTGHGAIFTVQLPNASILKPESVKDKNTGKFKILVVDDDPDIRDTIVDALKPLAAEIRVASDGLEGYAVFVSWDPDLVLSDVKMPEKTGIELLHDIKHSSPGTPVVLLSGALEDFGDGDVQTSLKPEAYLPKPFKSQELLALVNSIMKSEVKA